MAYDSHVDDLCKKLPARLGLLIIRPFSPYLKSQIFNFESNIWEYVYTWYNTTVIATDRCPYDFHKADRLDTIFLLIY